MLAALLLPSGGEGEGRATKEDDYGGTKGHQRSLQVHDMLAQLFGGAYGTLESQGF